MRLQPWYKVVVPREEVRQGRSFNPDEFAIALEQVVVSGQNNLETGDVVEVIAG